MKNRIRNEKKLIEYFEDWEGYNYFPLKAKYLLGPSSFKPSLVTFLITTIPVVLFSCFTFNFILEHMNISLIIILIIIYIITSVFLFLASYSDPGIINRYKGDNDLDIREKKINQLGYICRYKYCDTCGIIRPLRSTHCADCNNCVERFDHHCPWIGNCAGKRNYKYFFVFVILLNILVIYLAALCIAYVVYFIKHNIKTNDELNGKDKKDKITISFNDCIISLFVFIFCIFILIFTLGLLEYHIKLILTNLTTKEQLKSYYDNIFGNPFNKTRKYNCKSVLCSKTNKKSILKILKFKELEKELCDDNTNRSERTDNHENITRLNQINQNDELNNLNNMTRANNVNSSTQMEMPNLNKKNNLNIIKNTTNKNQNNINTNSDNNNNMNNNISNVDNNNEESSSNSNIKEPPNTSNIDSHINILQNKDNNSINIHSTPNAQIYRKDEQSNNKNLIESNNVIEINDIDVEISDLQDNSKKLPKKNKSVYRNKLTEPKNGYISNMSMENKSFEVDNKFNGNQSMSNLECNQEDKKNHEESGEDHIFDMSSISENITDFLNKKCIPKFNNEMKSNNAITNILSSHETSSFKIDNSSNI